VILFLLVMNASSTWQAVRFKLVNVLSTAWDAHLFQLIATDKDRLGLQRVTAAS